MMNSKALIFLILLIAVAGSSIFFLEENKKTTPNSKLFPNLSLSQINSVDKLTIQSAKMAVTLTKNQKGLWQVKERDDYPADVVKIRKLLVALSEADKIEQKMLRDIQYSELGLAMPSSATGTGTQLNVYAGDLLYTFLTGKNAPLFNNSQYVRLLSDDTSWLINRNLGLTADSSSWLDRQIAHINPEDVYKIRVIREGHKQIDIIRPEKGEPLDLLGAGEDQKEKNMTILKGLASVPEYLQFDDVFMKGEDFKMSENGVTVKYITFDGLEINYTSYAQTNDGTEKYYAVLTANVNEDISSGPDKERLKEKVEILSGVYEKWYFTTKKSVYDTVNSQLDALEASIEEAAEAETDTDNTDKSDDKK